jgi:hypothetical protein
VTDGSGQISYEENTILVFVESYNLKALSMSVVLLVAISTTYYTITDLFIVMNIAK